jgi:hypothetical protein
LLELPRFLCKRKFIPILWIVYVMSGMVRGRDKQRRRGEDGGGRRLETER